MKNILRITSLVLIISMFICLTAFGEEATISSAFSDLKADYWSFEGISKLVDAKIIQGYPDGTFKPDNYITRAELVKITNMVFGYTQKQDATSLTDVPYTEWYYDQVLIAQNAGYLDGYPDGTFKPNNNITREEFCKVLDAIVDFVELPGANIPSDDVSEWASDYVNKVLSNKIMLLDAENNFRAREFATRAEVCDALSKFLIIESEETAGTSSGSSGGSDTNKTEELYNSMNSVISVLNDDVISSLNADQAEIVNDIIENMNKYMKDNSHDYKAAADNTYDKYKELSEEEQTSLINSIKTQVPTLYLIELKDFFFPGANIDIK